MQSNVFGQRRQITFVSPQDLKRSLRQGFWVTLLAYTVCYKNLTRHSVVGAIVQLRDQQRVVIYESACTEADSGDRSLYHA